MLIQIPGHMRLKSFLLVLFCAALGACSSKPSEITYYQLNDTSVRRAGNVTIDKPQNSYVQLSKITVPDYLKQSKLVMRTAPFEMHFAPSHLWVQTPEKEIRAALLADLNAQNSDVWFVNFDATLKRNISKRLSIEITHFYPTENSEVIFKGYWTLQADSADSGKTHANTNDYNPFHFTAELEADGFSHAVAKQRSLISLLSEEIAAQIHGK